MSFLHVAEREVTADSLDFAGALDTTLLVNLTELLLKSCLAKFGVGINRWLQLDIFFIRSDGCQLSLVKDIIHYLLVEALFLNKFIDIKRFLAPIRLPSLHGEFNIVKLTLFWLLLFTFLLF